MFRVIFLLSIFISLNMAAEYTNKSHTRPWKVIYYPRGSMFKKSDLIDKGCVVFINECPSTYKSHTVCARHYDGHFRTFNNFCEVEYENCNSWRQWSVVKQVRC